MEPLLPVLENLENLTLCMKLKSEYEFMQPINWYIYILINIMHFVCLEGLNQTHYGLVIEYNNIYQILLRAARVKTVAEVTPGMKNSSRTASGITLCFMNRAANGTPKMHKIASFAPIPVNPDVFTKFCMISWNSAFVSGFLSVSLSPRRFYTCN